MNNKRNTPFQNNLHIMFANINGIREKIYETMQLAKEKHIDALIMNETKLANTVKLKLAGYTIFRNDRKVASGGTAIIINNKFDATELELPEQLKN